MNVAVGKHWRWLLIAVALLGLGWSIAPRSAPPLYDGVGFPDEPYRFVAKPAGAPDTKAPTVARATITVHGGESDAVHAQTAEQAPQLAMLVPVGRLHATGRRSTIDVTGTAIAPVAPPSGGYLWSNVYDITAGDGVTFTNADPAATITMRAATAQRPVPRIERYANGSWTPIATIAVGNDIYQAELTGLGRYAVVGGAPLKVSELTGVKSSSGTNATGIAIAAGAVVVVAGLVVVGERRRRARRAQTDTDTDTDTDPADTELPTPEER